ncbi:MAG: DNA polymerase III subunit alpha [Erysipelotrichaceae bacterium]
MATPLYIRTVYSLLGSMCRIEETVNKCKEYGYSSLGICDRSVLLGAAAFKKACKTAGIKPVFGMEVKVKNDKLSFNVLLYARDDSGFLNMMKLSSLINTTDKEVIDCKELDAYRKHCFLIIPSDEYFFNDGQDNDLKINELKTLFGDDFLVGMMDHNSYGKKYNDSLIRPALKEKGIRTIALNRSFYMDPEDARDYEILKCIKDKTFYNPDEGAEYGRYFLRPEEYDEYYEREDILNSDVLASLCNVNLDFHSSLPEYKCPKGIKSAEYLRLLSKEGLKRRLKGNINKQYEERLNYELEVIVRMHFEDYFLIVYDYILYAKKNGIFVGPGRGSAAGCLVCYVLGITDIDPLKYNLLFERFLNPERISLPDIDCDFPDERRDEVFNYVLNKYGEKHVAHIITYGTLKARQVIRDVGRVMKYSTFEIDQIAKLIPQDPKVTLKGTYESSKLFRQRIDYDERNRMLYETALKLEGIPRHISTHAAGVVFSSKELDEVTPLIKIEEDIYSTQYSMEYLEEMGLIKMDFLGLRNLSIINEIVDDIKKDNPEFDLKNIPLNDNRTFELISGGDTLGVFQLESAGMVNLARKMRPVSFEEVSMMLALFRPGPMENIPEFLKNRADKRNIHYICEDIKPILEETYGIILYQEQIMAIARKMAGFSYGRADVLRKAMSKKKESELKSLSADFIAGCINNGYSEKLANDIYSLIMKFANYGFNKSHSIAYGLLAYQMAYLKANYPLYFYKAVLNGVQGSSMKTFDYIKECRKRKITVLRISINNSLDKYRIVNNSLMMPFGIVRDVGSQTVKRIIEERSNGVFKDYIDAIVRLYYAQVDSRAIENLISAGAFDDFGLSRYTMSDSLANVLKYASTRSEGFVSIVDDRPIIKNMKDNRMVLAEKEKEVLGFYFSYNPINDYKISKNINCPSLEELSLHKGFVSGFGFIKKIKEIKTKKTGEKMAFIDIIDDSSAMSLTIFPNDYKKYEGMLKENTYVVFDGRMQSERELIVKRIEEV